MRLVDVLAGGVLLAAVIIGAGPGCSGDSPGEDRIGVIVTLLPQVEFVEAIGGDRVEVTVMVPPGADPHTYELTPGQMKKVSRANLYAKVGSGVEFELSWADKLIAMNRDMRVVDCSQGIELIEGVGDHEGGMDPHIWMSPRLAGIMVGNICLGLISIDPENRAYYEANRDAYLEKLEALDQEIRRGLAGIRNRTFMVYHPAFGYLAREYGLTMLPIEAEGKDPSAADLGRLIAQAKEQGIKVIFAEPQFNPQSARVIADEIGGRVILIDPLARDYLRNMRELADQLITAMQ